jgi:hypothetical protein
MPKPKDVPITLDKHGDETHPSWGTVTVHRISGSANLFDSVAQHQHFIGISIHRATRTRNLNQYLIHGGRKELIKIMLTESQFARLLSSAGDGGGVPCTISRLQGEMIPGAPPDKIGATYRQEVKESGKEATAALREVEKTLEALLEGKTIKKSQIKELQNTIHSACRVVDDHLPFLVGQVEEKLEQVVNEAKTNIDAFLQLRAQQLGIEKMLTDFDRAVPRLPGVDNEED